jgi:hypothetical protein
MTYTCRKKKKKEEEEEEEEEANRNLRANGADENLLIGWKMGLHLSQQCRVVVNRHTSNDDDITVWNA